MNVGAYPGASAPTARPTAGCAAAPAGCGRGAWGSGLWGLAYRERPRLLHLRFGRNMRKDLLETINLRKP